MDEILEKLPEEFNMTELFAKAEEKTPYVLVALQECERMNMLTRELRRSLKELDLGLKVSVLFKLIISLYMYALQTTSNVYHAGNCVHCFTPYTPPG